MSHFIFHSRVKMSHLLLSISMLVPLQSLPPSAIAQGRLAEGALNPNPNFQTTLRQ
jgi:hypothetical protein